MKNYFAVSFKYSEYVYCSNIAHAETAEAVAAHYSKYEWASVRECEDHEVETARKKGMPIIEIETAEPETAEPETAEPFPHLSAEIRTEYETRRKDAAHFVQFGFMPSWAEEHRTDPDRGLRQYSTPAKWAAYQAGTLSREKAVEIATRRALKEVTANEQKQIAKMETAANAPRLEWCQIAVEWVKNSYWGNNPHATVTASNMTTHGSASGCGYDKQSAAVAEALNANPAALRVLYEAAEKALAEGNRPARYSNGNWTWRDVLGYGSGYSILPYFESGVGVSCFWNILEKCGFVCRCGASSRHFDSYTVSR